MGLHHCLGGGVLGLGSGFALGLKTRDQFVQMVGRELLDRSLGVAYCLPCACNALGPTLDRMGLRIRQGLLQLRALGRANAIPLGLDQGAPRFLTGLARRSLLLL